MKVFLSNEICDLFSKIYVSEETNGLWVIQTDKVNKSASNTLLFLSSQRICWQLKTQALSGLSFICFLPYLIDTTIDCSAEN